MKDRVGGYTAFSATGLSGRNGPGRESYLKYKFDLDRTIVVR
jgi:hypothetical protein